MKTNPLYIFCGGGSRRMGRDKALLEIDNETILKRQIRRASPFFHQIALLSGSNAYGTDLRVVPDALHDAGPLSGLLAALQDAQKDHGQIAVTPVDVPFLSDETLRALSITKLKSGTQAVTLRAGEDIQPLAGIFSTDIAGDLKQCLGDGRYMVMKFLEKLEMESFSVPPEELRNINYPDDYRKLNQKR